MLNSDALAQELLPDGSLRDIYLEAEGLHAWRTMLELALQQDHRFMADGKPQAVPETLLQVFQMSVEAAVTLSFNWRGIAVNTHFFSEDQVEMDVNPKDLTKKQAINDLMDLLRALAARSGGTAILTHENRPAAVILSASPNGQVRRPETPARPQE